MKYRPLSLLLTLGLTVFIVLSVGTVAAVADEFLRLPFYIFLPGAAFLICFASLPTLWKVRERPDIQRAPARTGHRWRGRSVWNYIALRLSSFLRQKISWSNTMPTSTPALGGEASSSGKGASAASVMAVSSYRRSHLTNNTRFVLRSVVFSAKTAVQPNSRGDD